MNNIPECEKKIIPNLEWQPERVYCQTNNIVTCYQITEVNTSITTVLETIVIDIERPIFVMTFTDKEAADSLMDDLYYGEYTGA